MELVRNSINIAGLVDENELPDKMNGQIIQYSEVETIFCPENQPNIHSIFQIIIKVQINHSRRIKTPLGYTIVLDGIKKIKIIYTQEDPSGKANFLDLELPYNTYIELADPITIENVTIYILDAYFDLIDKRRIYSNILYLVHVSTTSYKNHTPVNNNENHPFSTVYSAEHKMNPMLEPKKNNNVFDNVYIPNTTYQAETDLKNKMESQLETCNLNIILPQATTQTMCIDQKFQAPTYEQSEELLLDIDAEYL